MNRGKMVNDAMHEVIKAQRQKTPFSTRYIEFVRANIRDAVRDSVIFNIVAWQQTKGKLRTDRQFEYYGKRHSKKEGWHESRFRANEDAIIANKSDAKMLEQMTAFRAENSLDMDEEGEAWFVYITEGGDRPIAILQDEVRPELGSWEEGMR
jgi:hypothetical protein